MSETLSRSDELTVVIPDGYRVETLPAGHFDQGPAFELTSQVTQTGNKVVVRRHLKGTRGRYAREDFERVISPLKAYRAIEDGVIVLRREQAKAPPAAMAAGEGIGVSR